MKVKNDDAEVGGCDMKVIIELQVDGVSIRWCALRIMYMYSCGRLHRAAYPLKVGANDLIRHKL